MSFSLPFYISSLKQIVFKEEDYTMNPDYPSNEVLAKQYVAVIYSRGNFAPSHRQAQKRIVIAPVQIAEVYAQYGTVRGHVPGIGPETAFVLDDIFKRGVTRVQELYRGAR